MCYYLTGKKETPGFIYTDSALRREIPKACIDMCKHNFYPQIYRMWAYNGLIWTCTNTRSLYLIYLHRSRVPLRSISDSLYLSKSSVYVFLFSLIYSFCILFSPSQTEFNTLKFYFLTMDVITGSEESREKIGIIEDFYNLKRYC